MNTDSLPFCDYLYSLDTECLPLYSPSCSPPKVRQVVAGAWLRQELQRSLTVFPRDQYFSCNTTHNIIHHTELAAMREMIRGVSKNKNKRVFDWDKGGINNLIIQKFVFLTPFLSERDWVANSRFCRYLRSHSVGAAPNYWLYALVRCDGKCDPGDSLDIPFRVSPTINNPPRSEIEMSPVSSSSFS